VCEEGYRTRIAVQPIVEDSDKTRALGPNQHPPTVATPAVDPDELRPGTTAGAYILTRELASGGGGTVYEAQHKLLGRKAAVKILRRELAASPQMVARFLREALAVNMIKHPSIVDIYEFGELSDGRPFYVMELLEGHDLRKLLTDRGRFSPEEVLEILRPVCSALEAAHSQGSVHRDLKASNIHIVDQHGQRVVKLLDFGIAKLMQPENAEAGLTVVERSMDRHDIYTADECFLTGTAAEVIPVVECDGRSIGSGKPGPVTTSMQEAYFAVIRGGDARHRDWLAFV